MNQSKSGITSIQMLAVRMWRKSGSYAWIGKTDSFVRKWLLLVQPQGVWFTREVFRPAIRHGATAIILAHNHPSGDPSPSSADLAVTQNIKIAAKYVDLEFHDHVILGEKQNCPNLLGYYSFSEAGLV